MWFFFCRGGEGIIYAESRKPGKVTLIGLYLETKCIEELTITVITNTGGDVVLKEEATSFLVSLVKQIEIFLLKFLANL